VAYGIVFAVAFAHRAMLFLVYRPMSNYGRMMVAFFVGENRVPDGLDLGDIVHQLRAGTLPEHTYLASGTNYMVKEKKSPPGYMPVRLYTLGFLAPLVLMLNVIGIHVLLPLVGLVWLVQRMRRSPVARLDPQRMAALLVSAVVYLYLTGVANLVETSENMRYRLEVSR
jgi:hypothetical protein